jgi:hypothetical protein
MIEPLTKARVNVTKYEARQYVYACQAFFDRCVEKQISIHSHPDLDAAVTGATQRTVGDGWAWARRNEQAVISPLVATTLAVDAASKPAARSWVM